MLNYILATALAALYLVMQGLIDERDRTIMALTQSFGECPLPEDREIMHVAKDGKTYQCSYTGWRNGDWHLLRKETM